jgi:hypothetical protein
MYQNLNLSTSYNPYPQSGYPKHAGRFAKSRNRGGKAKKLIPAKNETQYAIRNAKLWILASTIFWYFHYHF